MDAHRLNLPVQPFFATPEQRFNLARQRFFEDGQRPTGLVSESVIQSWSRCLLSKREPKERPSFDLVSHSRIHSSLHRHRDVLEAAVEPLAELDIVLSSSPCWAVLVDAGGVVMKVGREGERSRGTVLRTLLRVGMDLGEAAIGTGAPSLAAKIGRPCTVQGSEHYFEAIRTASCAAAPIRDESGEVIAVLDLSAEDRLFGFDTESLVALYATLIENRLLLSRAKGQWVLHFHTSRALVGSLHEGLAGIDEHGRVRWTNLLAAGWIGPHGDDAETVFGLTAPRLAGLLGQAQPVPLRLANGLTVWVRARLNGQDRVQRLHAMTPALAPAPATVEPCPVIPSDRAVHAQQDRSVSLEALTDRHVTDALAACGGNISSAATALGVSRGLIYRRLRRMTPKGTT